MAFSYYRTITIDKTKVPNTDRTDFPVLVSGTYTYLKTTGNGGNVQNANGYDVGFYSNSSLTTKLKWETEKYTATTGEVVYWVKVPTVSTSTDTVIYMAYGDSSISTDQSDPTNVWDSNYKSVYHLKDGTTLSGADSTSNANNGTINGSPTAVAGKIDGAGNSTGYANYIGVPSGVLSVSTDNLTLSMWYKPSSLTDYNSLFSIFNNDNDALDIFTISGTSRLYGGNYNNRAESANGSLSVGTWTYIVLTGVNTGGTTQLYINGATSGTTGTLNFTTARANAGAIFRRLAQTYNANGDIDEVRLSNTLRSADWIATEYNNQNSPSTFYTVGSETPAGGTTVNSGFFQFM